MAANIPLEELPGPSTNTPPKLPSFSPNPSTTATATATATVLRPPGLPPPSDVDVSHIPSYSRWFSWDNIHECELRFLPEFFDSRSPSKNPRVYMYYRNSIIKLFRENPARKITFTDARKTLVGDVGSIRRVFDFLDAWGLINYSPSASNKPLKWDDKESKATAAVSQSGEAGGGSGESSGPNKENSKRLCSGCKSLCSIACFACEKYDLTLCARCYVRGNYRVGVSSSDFRRVEISEEKTNWTDKETLLLLEALLQYGDDWKKVAQHVGGRSDKECVSQFIKLPFGEEFIGYLDSGEVNKDAEYGLENNGMSSPSKKMRLTPLADASNPIMAQAAFLSALAGEEIAEAAALAAVKTLSEVDFKASTESFGSLGRSTRQKATDAGSNGDTASNAFEEACLDANSLLDKEERDMQRAISEITEVHIPEIKDKIVRFEELDLLMEKELQQLEQMKNLLFLDQLNLLFENGSAPKSGNVRTD